MPPAVGSSCVGASCLTSMGSSAPGMAAVTGRCRILAGRCILASPMRLC